MLSSLFSASNLFTTNNVTQRALAQSVNLSYAARGIYRVQETQPSRKGDYWFRDFGMVMACTYMTELGFRSVDRYYTVPLLNNKMELNALTGQNMPYIFNGKLDGLAPQKAAELRNLLDKGQIKDGELLSDALYPNARNYKTLPEFLRTRMMGSLVRNSNENLPVVLKENTRNEIEALKDGELKDLAKTIFKSPFRNTDAEIEEYLAKKGLAGVKDQLADIAMIDNKQAQDEAIDALLQKNPALKNNKHVQKGIQLYHFRQMGILTDHLYRNLNPKSYFEENFLAEKRPEPFEALVKTREGSVRKEPMRGELKRANEHSKVSEVAEILQERMKHYSKALNSLYGVKSQITAAVEEISKKPLEKREEEFKKHFKEIKKSLYLYNKISMMDIPISSNKKDMEIIKQKLRKNLQEQASENLRELSPNTKHLYTEYKQCKEDLKQFLLNDKNKTISARNMEIGVGKFNSLFDMIHNHKELRTNTLELLWDNIKSDIQINLKRNIKNIADTINELPLPHEEKVAHIEAKFKNMGLTDWFSDKEISASARALGNALPTQNDLVQSLSKEVLEQRIKTAIKTNIITPLDNKTPDELLKPLLSKQGQSTMENGSFKKQFQRLILEGMNSKAMQSGVEKIQRSSTWPKMAATVALNLVFYGWLASRFDNNVLQPYQEKLVARKGTSQDIVTAGYLGAIPGAMVLSQLFDKTALKPVQKMGFFKRFATVGGGALGVFAASTYGMLKVLEKRPPKNPPIASAETPGTHHTSLTIPTGVAPSTTRPVSGFTGMMPSLSRPSAFAAPQPFQSFKPVANTYSAPTNGFTRYPYFGNQQNSQ